MRIARACLRINLAETRRSFQQQVLFGEDPEVSSEALKQTTASAACHQIEALVRIALKTGDTTKAKEVADIACEFFEANGMAYRQLEGDAHSYDQKGKPASVGNQLPSRIPLWLAPSISLESSTLGPNSLIGVDRETLVTAACRFFASGVRCKWFEKMLVEALICAETFATVKESRSNPAFWFGHVGLTRQLAWTFVHQATRGEHPKLELALLAANYVLGLVKTVAVIALAWYSYVRYDEGKWISGGLGLIVAGWIALNAVGKFVVRRLMTWSKHPGELAMSAIRAAPVGAAVQAMLRTYRSAVAGTMSPTLVRANVLAAASADALFDSVVVAFLDRAVAAGEFAWSSSEAGDAPFFDDDWDDDLGA